MPAPVFSQQLPSEEPWGGKPYSVSFLKLIHALLLAGCFHDHSVTASTGYFTPNSSTSIGYSL